MVDELAFPFMYGPMRDKRMVYSD